MFGLYLFNNSQIVLLSKRSGGPDNIDLILVCPGRRLLRFTSLYCPPLSSGRTTPPTKDSIVLQTLGELQ